MEFGPDGSLFVLEYGDGLFHPNPDAQLSVIRHVKGTRSPVAVLDATPTSGQAPLTVSIDSTGSHDPDPDPGELISYAWDVTDDLGGGARRSGDQGLMRGPVRAPAPVPFRT